MIIQRSLPAVKKSLCVHSDSIITPAIAFTIENARVIFLVLFRARLFNILLMVLLIGLERLVVRIMLIRIIVQLRFGVSFSRYTFSCALLNFTGRKGTLPTQPMKKRRKKR